MRLRIHPELKQKCGEKNNLDGHRSKVKQPEVITIDKICTLLTKTSQYELVFLTKTRSQG